MILLPVGLIPSQVYYSHYGPTGQTVFRYCIGWHIILGLFSFLLPSLVFVLFFQEQNGSLAWRNRLLFTVIWGLACAPANPVEETLFSAVLLFGCLAALDYFRPLRRWKRAAR